MRLDSARNSIFSRRHLHARATSKYAFIIGSTLVSFGVLLRHSRDYPTSIGVKPMRILSCANQFLKKRHITYLSVVIICLIGLELTQYQRQHRLLCDATERRDAALRTNGSSRGGRPRDRRSPPMAALGRGRLKGDTERTAGIQNRNVFPNLGTSEIFSQGIDLSKI